MSGTDNLSSSGLRNANKIGVNLPHNSSLGLLYIGVVGRRLNNLYVNGKI